LIAHGLLASEGLDRSSPDLDKGAGPAASSWWQWAGATSLSL